MRKFLFPLGVLILSGCATPAPIPPDIKAAVEKIPVADLQQSPITEQQRCGRSHFFSQRQECKYRIRREKAERKIMQEREGQ